MKILFVRERWADGDSSKGPSDGSYMISTWQRANTADCWQTFYYDEPTDNLDAKLIDVMEDFDADLVMFSHLLSWGPRNIKKETWNRIRNDYSQVVGVWHESSPDVIRVADEHADCVDLNLFLDTTSQFLNYTKRPEKCFGLFDPRDANEFKPLEKDIGILFNGTLVNRPFRVQGVMALLVPQLFGIQANGIGVTHIGGRSELFIPQEQMVEMLGRAKICLNFSDGGQGKHYKGRVAEALLSGCLLMEWENAETSSILTPFKEYVPFDGPQDLVQKCAYYLSSNGERERQKIAEAGRAAALEKLDGRMFWKELFERLKLYD